MSDNKGQNLVEYILLVTAVAVVCIYFFGNQAHSPMGESVNASLNSMVNMINIANSAIQFSS